MVALKVVWEVLVASLPTVKTNRGCHQQGRWIEWVPQGNRFEKDDGERELELHTM